MNKAYIVAVDMGYGHKRAAFPLASIAATPAHWNISDSHAGSQIISANNYPGIPAADKKRWDGSQKGYETVSRLKDLPLIGDIIFGVMDYFQNIFPLYPLHDASKPTFQLKQIYNWIDAGWGTHLIDELNKDPLPYIATFFTAAFFAEEHGYKGDIYLLCTDTDVSRAWAPIHPEASRIKYFAPTYRVVERLKSYGVRSQNIILTGFPLPKELLPAVGREDIIKEQTIARILKLDPNGIYRKQALLALGESTKVSAAESDLAHEPIKIAYAIGGAGAGQNIGLDALSSLSSSIKNGLYSFTLIAGSNKSLFDTFTKAIHEHGLTDFIGRGIDVLYDANKDVYFKKFNDLLPSVDILWTKPSELSFYARLGLPIIMAPAVGAQERCNIEWLYQIGAGIKQNEPIAAGQWLNEWIQSGILARMALNGFLAPLKFGADEIESAVFKEKPTVTISKNVCM